MAAANHLQERAIAAFPEHARERSEGRAYREPRERRCSILLGDVPDLPRPHTVGSRRRELAPLRGLITDRNGVKLAENRQHWRAMLMPSEAQDPGKVVSRFADIVKLSPEELAKIGKALARHRHYLPIVLKNYLDWPEMARIEVHATDLPGVFIDMGATRIYPLGSVAAHLIGYVARPTPAQADQNPVLALPGMRVGRNGVERSYNAPLTGAPGVLQTEVNVHGTVIRVLNRDAGTQGQTVELALDSTLQETAASRLEGQAGAAVLIDALNGEVHAMASRPSFDPGLFGTGVPASVWHQWMHDKRRPLTDRATDGLYAPGSAFKPNVALAALECGAITTETTYYCPGYLKLGDHVFWCWKHYGHGTMDVVSAIQQSCDVFFYHTAIATGIDQMARMARRLGLIGDTGIDLPGVNKGFLPTLEWARERRIAWTHGLTAIQGIGQGYTQVTPLGLATMTARIATGKAVAPRVARQVGGERPPGIGASHAHDLGFSPRNLAAVRQGMFEVVNTRKGTAWAARLQLPGVTMSGKTGTAQVHSLTEAQERANFNDADLPWKDRPNAFFIAFAPSEAPRFAVAVAVEHGNEGAEAAAPIAHDLISAALSRTPDALPGASSASVAGGPKGAA